MMCNDSRFGLERADSIRSASNSVSCEENTHFMIKLVKLMKCVPRNGFPWVVSENLAPSKSKVLRCFRFPEVSARESRINGAA